MSLVIDLIYLVAKHKSGELRCPATALIAYAKIQFSHDAADTVKPLYNSFTIINAIFSIIRGETINHDALKTEYTALEWKHNLHSVQCLWHSLELFLNLLVPGYCSGYLVACHIYHLGLEPV